MPLFIILITAALILSYNLDKPFWGHHDWNGVYWGQVAKNFASYGPVFSRFGMFVDAGPVTTPSFNFHYLPTFPLIWAGFFKVFGVANWVSRFMAILFSLASIAVFYKIISKYFSIKTAVFASLFWMATPMFSYFGKMPVHEIPLMFFVLLTFYFFLANRYLLTAICCTLAMLITWPGFFLVPVLVLFNRKYWVLIPTAFFLFGVHLTHNYFVTGNFLGGGLGDILQLRTSGGNLAWYLWYAKTLTSWAWAYYFILVPLSLLGLVVKCNRITIMFLLFAALYPIVFRDASSRHDYLLIYFWPFISLSSALIIRRWQLAVLLISLFIYFRWDFIVALQESSLYKQSVLIGQAIKPKTRPGDMVRIISYDEDIPFDGWFASYYSDRPVVYTTDTKTSPDPRYKDFYVFSDGTISPGAEINNKGIK